MNATSSNLEFLSYRERVEANLVVLVGDSNSDVPRWKFYVLKFEVAGECRFRWQTYELNLVDAEFNLLAVCVRSK